MRFPKTSNSATIYHAAVNVPKSQSARKRVLVLIRDGARRAAFRARHSRRPRRCCSRQTRTRVYVRTCVTVFPPRPSAGKRSNRRETFFAYDPELARRRETDGGATSPTVVERGSRLENDFRASNGPARTAPAVRRPRVIHTSHARANTDTNKGRD